MKFVPGETTDCPFCDGWICADVDRIALLHSMPICPKYAELDPLEFVKAANLKLENDTRKS